MKVLVTGGAGFIGSNLTKALLNESQIGLVRVLDNFSTGFKSNIEEFMSNDKFELIEGDIRDFQTCQQACKDIDVISHQAALGSVPRSIEDPLSTNAVNITGALNLMTLAKESGAKFIFAASSSTYGDSKKLPKKEDEIGNPLSPYAVTKLVNEIYVEVYHKVYNLDYIGLRYFNIFGPNQSPKGAYAAVIPLFFDALLKNQGATIHGDGTQSRDFTYVGNAVKANLLCIFNQNKDSWNQIYNVGCGSKTSLLELYQFIQEVTGKSILPKFSPPRAGDVKESLADIGKAQKLLSYQPEVTVKEGLSLYYQSLQNS